MRFKLHANSVIDMLTPEEHRQHLSEQTKELFQEQARGFTIERFDSTGTVTAGALQLPETGNSNIGPKLGYAWKVTRISINGLTGSDTLAIFRNDLSPRNFVDQLTATRPTVYPKTGLLLRAGDSLIATGASLTATGDLTLTGEVTEASELDLYKLL